MPNRKAPSAGGRWGFCKIRIVYPIIATLDTESKCRLRERALLCREVAQSEDPRVIALGRELLRHSGELPHLGGRTW